MVLVHCTFSHCTQRLNEVLLNYILSFESYSPDKKTLRKGNESYSLHKKKVRKGNNYVIGSNSYGSCTMHCLLLCLNIVESFIRFNLIVFKLFSGQEKVTKGNNSVIR